MLTRPRKILEQLVYARHNAKFSDKFYEGYFNLFAFYNDQSKVNSRVNINEVVLTEVDQENLRLIKSIK